MIFFHTLYILLSLSSHDGDLTIEFYHWFFFPKLNKNAHLISVQDGDRCSASNLGPFTPREELPLPCEQEVGWAPEPSWTLRRERKSFFGPDRNVVTEKGV